MNQSDTASLWLLVSTGFVLFMQAGFLCLEAGSVRRKNSVNVAMKNFVVEILTTCTFFTIGYAIMFGGTWKGIFGVSAPALGGIPKEELFQFLFQAVFCSTSATIVSGAVAERLRFLPFLLQTALLSAFLYPLFGHWVWGQGWLSSMGYHDFAGSSVVHLMGAGAGLSGIVLLGPRRGRFVDGKVRNLGGSNLIIAALGTFILIVGWIGFNGGSAPFGMQTASIVANTLLAGCFAGLTAMSSTWITRGIADPILMMNGTLGGLVAITACADIVPLQAAPLLGVAAGLATHGATWALERLQLDDAVGAIPVHGACGILGILATPLLASGETLASHLAAHPLTSRLDWFGIQCVGVVACLAVSVGGGFLAWIAIGRFAPLRVSPDAEQLGMNFSEHRLEEEEGTA
ncbi:MAG: ammonium transporter [Fibrobacteria bacterium]|nr:ammonium transporter [Fibrobacteria bacterium]